MRLKARCLFVKLGITYLMLFGGMMVMASIVVMLGLNSLPTGVLIVGLMLASVPLFTIADRTGAREAAKLEAREKENALEKLARL